MRSRFTRWALDASERCGKTFVQVFIAQLTASGLDIAPALSDVSNLHRAAIAGLGAVASLVMSAASRWAGSPASASLVD